MKIVQCSQGGHEWFQARLGRVTSSRMADALSFLKRGEKKGGETEKRSALKGELIAEILTGQADEDRYVSDCMRWGTNYENEARSFYEMRNDALVRLAGFVLHPTIELAGASPDGLVGKDGGVELKAPKTHTHINYLRARILPPDYEPQVMWCIGCCEREWWDIASYDPRLNNRFKMMQVRTYRDDKRIEEMEDGVRLINQEVADIIGELELLYPEIIEEATPITLPYNAAGEVDLSRLTDQLMGSILQ